MHANRPRKPFNGGNEGDKAIWIVLGILDPQLAYMQPLFG